jgi:probable HAF family extracellular repeat protein
MFRAASSRSQSRLSWLHSPVQLQFLAALRRRNPVHSEVLLSLKDVEMWLLRAFCFSMIGLSLLPSTARAVNYHLTELPSIPSAQQYSFSYATGINNAGQISGYASTGGGGVVPELGFIYANGAIEEIGTLGGRSSYAFGISPTGMVVGSSLLPGNSIAHAVSYSNGQLLDLGSPPGGASEAYAANASGQIVGRLFYPTAPGSNPYFAFLYENGVMTELETFGGDVSHARGINAVGQITGSASLASGPEQAFIYSNGVATSLGTLTGPNGGSNGMAINDLGHVAGSSQLESGFHPVLFSNGTLLDLGTLGGPYGIALGLNNSGDVVGWALTDSPVNPHEERGFIFTHGAMTDLNLLLDPSVSGWVITSAKAINDSGWIAAEGYNTSNRSIKRALLLTPVPEPIGAASILAVMTCVALGRRHKRTL